MQVWPDLGRLIRSPSRSDAPLLLGVGAQLAHSWACAKRMPAFADARDGDQGPNLGGLIPRLQARPCA